MSDQKKKYDLRLRGEVGYWDFDYDYIQYVLDRSEGASVAVNICSYGGDLNTALLVSDAFANHGDVSVHFTGFNASAATVAALGAKRVTIDAGAFYLVHKCSVPFIEFAWLNADQLRNLSTAMTSQAGQLDKVDLSIAELYAARCRKSVEELLNLMTQGGWITAQEALEWGFVDEVTNHVDDTPATPTEDVVNAFVAAGTPLPACALSRPNLMQRITKAITDAFASTMPTSSETSAEIISGVCDLLDIDEISFRDGFALLTHDQVLAIDDTLRQHDTELATRNEKITALEQHVSELQTRISELQTIAGAEPKKVVAQTAPPTVAEDSYYQKLQRAKESYKRI